MFGSTLAVDDAVGVVVEGAVVAAAVATGAVVREAASRGNRVLAAASEKLGAPSEALEEAVKGGVIPFKGRLSPKDVLLALDADT